MDTGGADWREWEREKSLNPNSFLKTVNGASHPVSVTGWYVRRRKEEYKSV